MVRGNLNRQYREAHIVSSSPGEMVLMLYDGAIRFLKQAIEKIGEKNIGAKVQLLEKVEKIIDYLESCLDRKNGGEIAENLQKLYGYMLVRLTEANLYNDVAKLEEIGSLLGTVREGWAGICGAANKGEEPKASQPQKSSATAKNIVVSV